MKKLAAFSLVSIITFGLGVTVHRFGSAATRYFSEPSAWQVLLSFENQDLAGLDEQSMRAVQRAIHMTTGPVNSAQNPRFGPRLFRKISNNDGEPRYILVEEAPMWSIPGESTIRVHIFSTAGQVLSRAEFSAGNRFSIGAMVIRKTDELKSEILRLDGEYLFSGQASSQYYMVVGNELRLVHLYSLFRVHSNDYTDPRLTIGPRVNLSADDWEKELQSTDDARVMSALTWLGGFHWNGQEPPYDEDRPDGEKVTNLRARESVRRRLADLANSTNYFIRLTAEAILKEK